MQPHCRPLPRSPGSAVTNQRPDVTLPRSVAMTMWRWLLVANTASAALRGCIPACTTAPYPTLRAKAPLGCGSEAHSSRGRIASPLLAEQLPLLRQPTATASRYKLGRCRAGVSSAGTSLQKLMVAEANRVAIGVDGGFVTMGNDKKLIRCEAMTGEHLPTEASRARLAKLNARERAIASPVGG